MKLLVVGAGASHGEGLAAGFPVEQCPPLMKNFARVLWHEYNEHHLLSMFLLKHGHEPGRDAAAAFIDLEAKQTKGINIESFFEFAYAHRGFVPPGHERFSPATSYENLLLHGILNPLSFLLIQTIFASGHPTLPLAERVAAKLQPGDWVLNFNYDTIFECAARNAGHALTFVPNPPDPRNLMISKPHGSFNLFVRNETFDFREPLFAGAMQPADARSFIGFLPPRLNKNFEQHPIAKVIVEATKSIKPQQVVFWGVGFTESDADLVTLLKGWCQHAHRVEFINPSEPDVVRAQELLATKGQRFANSDEWCCVN
jgi:hypothetical protein